MKFSKEQFDEFVKAIAPLVSADAEAKGYTETHALKEALGIAEGHALGEIIYKATRYRRFGVAKDLEKIAAWAFVLWATEAGRYRGVIEE